MSSSNIRDLLTSFSPSFDLFAITSGDGRIKFWDTLKGQYQTAFTDSAEADEEFGMGSESKRGHLALDYKCMHWVQLENKKKKKKIGSSLLVLGTGNGDVLGVDVALNQSKWKLSDCHPGGVTSVSFSTQNSCIYTAGVDGMICQIDSLTGKILSKFKPSTKAISALSISADGKLLATASGQMKIFGCSNNKKIQKFSGHPVAVRCMIFSEDGKYVLSSGVGEKYVAIWRIDGGKKQFASCVLCVDHPALFIDSKGSDTEGSDCKVVGLYVLAITELGVCYFWHGDTIEALQTCRPTKISLSSESSLSNTNGLAIYAAKFHHIVRPASASMLIAYGSLIKPSFEKLVVECGNDVILDASQDGILLQSSQPNSSIKRQVTQTKVTALDRANAEDAVLPLPKLYGNEKKRKHSISPLVADVEKVADPVNNINKSRPNQVYPQKIEEDGLTCIEDKLREAGIHNLIVKSYNNRSPPDAALNSIMSISGFSVGGNMTTKKIRSHILSMNPSDAYKLLESLLSSWRARSANSKDALPWIYHILVIHGHFIIAQESSKHLFDALHKMTRLRSATIQPLLKLLGCLQLIMSQIDKAGQVLVPSSEHRTDQSDDEDIDELVYGEDEDASESSGDGSDDDN